MELKDLRVGLTGFRKSDVCEYISELNRDFAARLSARQEEQQADMARLSAKNEELHRTLAQLEMDRDALTRALEEKEQALAGLQAELGSLQEQLSAEACRHDEVTELLLDARQFAESVRAKATAEAETLRQEWRQRQAAEQKRLAAYETCVAQVRQNMAAALEEMDRRLAAVDEEIAALQAGKNGGAHEED